MSWPLTAKASPPSNWNSAILDTSRGEEIQGYFRPFSRHAHVTAPAYKPLREGELFRTVMQHFALLPPEGVWSSDVQSTYPDDTKGQIEQLQTAVAYCSPSVYRTPSSIQTGHFAVHTGHFAVESGHFAVHTGHFVCIPKRKHFSSYRTLCIVLSVAYITHSLP